MKSLLAGTAFAAMLIAALAVARSQTMPDATPSMCPSPSATNGLVDSTLAHDCTTPKPAATATPSTGLPRPTAQPTSEAQLR